VGYFKGGDRGSFEGCGGGDRGSLAATTWVLEYTKVDGLLVWLYAPGNGLTGGDIDPSD